MRKKAMLITLSTAIIVLITNPLQAKDFSGRETEMNRKCAAIYDEATQRECLEYKEYLNNKSNNLDKEIGDLDNQIAKVSNDIVAISDLIKTNQQKIKSYDTEIRSAQAGIETSRASIAKLKIAIEAKAEDIKKRDKLMKDRLLVMQPYIGSNNFIDFLMGATSFTDLLRRTQIVSELNTYESDQIKVISKEKEELNTQRKSVETQEELLVEQKKIAEQKKLNLEKLNKANEELEGRFHKEESDYKEKQRLAQLAQKKLPNISTDLIPPELDKPENPEEPDKPVNPDNPGGGTVPSDGFISPLNGGWTYTAGTWYYPAPWSGVHVGMDFAIGNGNPVMAPASGVVIHTYTGCAGNGGYLGNWCGDPFGAGNNVTMLSRVNGEVYAFLFFHFTSVSSSIGNIVKQGSVLGYTGKSGNTTGPHLHAEVIKLGKMTLSEAVSLYNSTGDVTFGLGMSEPNACGSAPCRIRPEDLWL